jgi:hypothetical protein
MHSPIEGIARATFAIPSAAARATACFGSTTTFASAAAASGSIKAMGGELNDLALDGLSIDLHGQSLADVL